METQDPRARLLRRIIIDMLPFGADDEDILEMQERLGLVPSSLDVLELDRRESNDRIQRLGPVSNLLTVMSGYSAEAIAEYFLMMVGADDDATTDDPDDEDAVPTDYLRSVLVKQNMQVIATAVHGIVSHLISSGVLVLNKDKMPQ